MNLNVLLLSLLYISSTCLILFYRELRFLGIADCLCGILIRLAIPLTIYQRKSDAFIFTVYKFGQFANKNKQINNSIFNISLKHLVNFYSISEDFYSYQNKSIEPTNPFSFV